MRHVEERCQQEHGADGHTAHSREPEMNVCVQLIFSIFSLGTKPLGQRHIYPSSGNILTLLNLRITRRKIENKSTIVQLRQAVFQGVPGTGQTIVSP